MEKILIADDDKEIREIIKATLSPDKFSIIEAVDGMDALQKARDEKPRLMVLDVMMPRMNGFDICRRLKEAPETAGIIIVMLTGSEKTHGEGAALLAGADHYMQKPFSPLKLLRLIDAIVPG